MKHLLSISIAAFAFSLAASASQASCYADYKAKRDDPLKLHYGVVELPDAACGSKKAAGAEISSRISRDGWKLLSVSAIFGEDGLKERKKSAGAYFLRY